jgi:hypothetical protein
LTGLARERHSLKGACEAIAQPAAHDEPRLRRPIELVRRSSRVHHGPPSGIRPGFVHVEQCGGRAREDVVGVRRVEVDRAVDLEDVAGSALVPGDVDAGEVEPEGGDRVTGERGRCRRGVRAPADGTEGNVCAPFAGRCVALDGPTTRPPATTTRRSRPVGSTRDWTITP